MQQVGKRNERKGKNDPGRHIIVKNFVDVAFFHGKSILRALSFHFPAHVEKLTLLFVLFML